MTEQLAEFQHELLERLHAAGGTRTAVVAQVGSGITRPLAELVKENVDSGERAVIVASNRLVADQWAVQLDRAGVGDIKTLTGGAAALEALDRRNPQSTKALVGTVRIMTNPTGVRAVKRVKPSLLIVDLPHWTAPSGLIGALESVWESVGRTILVTRSSEPPDWFGADSIVRVSLDQTLGLMPDTHDLVVISYEGDPAERLVRDRLHRLTEGRDFLRSFLAKRSRPALHTTLISLAMRLEASKETSEGVADDEPVPIQSWFEGIAGEELWGLIDDLESLDQDPRLEVAKSVVSTAVEHQKPVVVVTDFVAEIDYIASSLHDRDIPVDTLTARSSFDERAELLNSFQAGQVLLVTTGVYESIDQPEGTEVVSWSLPRTLSGAIARLARGADRGRSIFLWEQPTQDGDDLPQILDQLERLGVSHMTQA